jgi:manganese/zinc/iron transport system permease protein
MKDENESIIPPFSWQEHVIDPWGVDEIFQTVWLLLMAICVITTCGMVGNYLILRRMALVGDAISHSVLAGIAVVVVAPFIFQTSLTHFQPSTTALFIGALVAGIFTTVLIELIHRYTRVKQDAAIGIAFTSLFALGVVLITVFVKKAHIDTDCILFGNFLEVSIDATTVSLSPELAESVRQNRFGAEFLMGQNELALSNPVLRMAGVMVFSGILIFAFYKELLVSSFDPGLAVSLGIKANVVHYALMCVLSLVVVSAFESVGAILVVAMLILPGATAHLISDRLPAIMALTVLHALIASLLGCHLSVWWQTSVAGSLVVASTILFTLAWLFSPHDGLLGKYLRQQRVTHEMPDELSGKKEPNPAA